MKSMYCYIKIEITLDADLMEIAKTKKDRKRKL